MRANMKVKIEITDEDIKWPEYKTEWAAAADIVAPCDIELSPRTQPVSLELNFKTNIPKGYVAILAPRSGLGNLGLALANTIGIIDADYPGVWNAKVFVHYWADPLFIKKGERFIQVLFVKAERAKFYPGSVEQVTDRTGGHGSTGRF